MEAAAESPELAPQVQRLICSEQERGYRNLALKLGLGADPKKAYERLSGGAPSGLSHSPYEDPGRYRIMTIILGGIHRALVEGASPQPGAAPAFASLPSGDVNARVIIEPETLTPVIFFEQGLFHFFYDFCHLIGWAIPPIPEGQLGDDAALSSIESGYTMPPEASFSFVSALGAYTFEGSPLVNAPRVAPPTHNVPICIVLLNLMERFVMAHETAHILRGHLEGPPTRDHELEADAAGLSLVLQMGGREGLAWSVSYWACELALDALNILYRAFNVASFGATRPSWIDGSHPDPFVRREELRQIWLVQGMPEDGVNAARMLCGMSDAVIQRLWEVSLGPLMLAHQGGARPSPMWREFIESTFAAKN